jgi:GNAT superfamily N-acetyltransferase
MSARIRVRRAEPEDWVASRALRLRALADSPDAFASTLEREAAFGDDVWRSRLENAATYVAVDDDGTLSGSVTGIDDRHESGGREVVAMWVAPESRGRGVGEALIGAVVEWARELDAPAIALWVADGNDRARRLYERVGFRDTGQRDVMREGLGESRLRMPLD